MYFKERPYKLYQCFFLMKLVYPQQAELVHGYLNYSWHQETSTWREALSEIRILSKGYQFILCSVNSDILFKPT